MTSASEIFQNRCRLCLEDNGIDVQRLKYKDKMLELVSISSGIQITDFLIGPKKICENCCFFALKFHAYRKISAENNRWLTRVFGQQTSQNTQTDLCLETRSTTDAMTGISPDSIGSVCVQNQAHLSGGDKQVIEIRVHVNATVQTESEQNRNISTVSEKQGNVQDVRIEITSPLKHEYEKDHHAPAVHTEDAEARKCKFLTTLGLISTNELTALQQSKMIRPLGYSGTLVSRVAGLSRNRRRKCDVRKILRFHQTEYSKHQKSARSYKGRNVPLPSLLQRIPVVKLTRMDECKKLRKKYFAQISSIQNTRCYKKFVKL